MRFPDIFAPTKKVFRSNTIKHLRSYTQTAAIRSDMQIINCNYRILKHVSVFLMKTEINIFPAISIRARSVVRIILFIFYQFKVRYIFIIYFISNFQFNTAFKWRWYYFCNRIFPFYFSLNEQDKICTHGRVTLRTGLL